MNLHEKDVAQTTAEWMSQLQKDLEDSSREFAAANYYYGRALELTPRSVSGRLTRAITYLNLTGDVQGARKAVAEGADRGTGQRVAGGS